MKNYLVLIKGQLAQNSGLIESFLSEDEDYVVHSSQDNSKGKLARTEYRVIKQYDKFSLLKINLLTGKKNQIRVHLAELGHPVLGDEKYGDKKTVYKNLMLHSYSLEITHPFKMERVRFSAPPPEHFLKLSGSLEFN